MRVASALGVPATAAHTLRLEFSSRSVHGGTTVLSTIGADDWRKPNGHLVLACGYASQAELGAWQNAMPAHPLPMLYAVKCGARMCMHMPSIAGANFYTLRRRAG
jgi:hypothetical protein